VSHQENFFFLIRPWVLNYYYNIIREIINIRILMRMFIWDTRNPKRHQTNFLVETFPLHVRISPGAQPQQHTYLCVLYIIISDVKQLQNYVTRIISSNYWNRVIVFVFLDC